MKARIPKEQKFAYGPKPMARRTYIFRYGGLGWVIGRVIKTRSLLDRRKVGWIAEVEPLYIKGEYMPEPLNLWGDDAPAYKEHPSVLYIPCRYVFLDWDDTVRYSWEQIDEDDIAIYALLGEEY